MTDATFNRNRVDEKNDVLMAMKYKRRHTEKKELKLSEVFFFTYKLQSKLTQFGHRVN